jgi:hypothetical protein
MKGKLQVLIYICIALLFVSASAFAGQGKELSLRVSYYEPEDAEPGFAIGGSFGTAFNDFVSISVGTDVYFKNYEQRTDVASEESETYMSTLYTTDVKYRALAIPLMLEVKLNIQIIGPLSIFGHAGGGYEIFWVKELNPSAGVSDNTFFGGFTWVAGVGPSFRLGHDTWLFVEGYYTGATVKRDRKDITQDLPVYEEVDLSGFGIRAGITLMTF